MKHVFAASRLPFTALAISLAIAASSSFSRARADPTDRGVPRAGAAAVALEGSLGGALDSDRAVAIALQRNRDVLAARLRIQAAELERIAASIYPNPVLSYTVGNLPLGAGSPYNVSSGAPSAPGFLSQPVHSVALAEVIDVWAKRSRRALAAERGVEVARLEVEDALREIAHAVRSAFADAERERSERALALDMRGRYAETVRLSRARFAAGEISEAELRKIELEDLRYHTDAIEAAAEYDRARQKLAALLGLTSVEELPAELVEEPRAGAPLPLATLLARALASRPDVRAAERTRAFASAVLGAARREALPDPTVSATYTRSTFTVSGDNPNTLAFGVALPLPLFDRNQANIGRAELEGRRAANEAERLVVVVSHEVAGAVRDVERARELLEMFERGGMLERAERSLAVAEKSYQAGAISLLELLEAQRTFLETRARYLRAQYDDRQARIDLRRAVGSDVP